MQRQAVHDGGEHSHVIGGRGLDRFATSRELRAAKQVAAADDDRQLDTARVDALQLLGDGLGLVEVNAELVPAVAERFAAELQEDALDISGSG